MADPTGELLSAFDGHDIEGVRADEYGGPRPLAVAILVALGVVALLMIPWFFFSKHGNRDPYQ
jgi:hypothetical protein